MIIPIDDKYRLKSDINQWMIQKKIKPNKKNPDGWESFKYFNNPSQAVTALAAVMVRTSDASTLTDALAEVDRVTQALVGALTPVFTVQLKGG